MQRSIDLSCCMSLDASAGASELEVKSYHWCAVRWFGPFLWAEYASTVGSAIARSMLVVPPSHPRPARQTIHTLMHACMRRCWPAENSSKMLIVHSHAGPWTPLELHRRAFFGQVVLADGTTCFTESWFCMSLASAHLLSSGCLKWPLSPVDVSGGQIM